MRNTVLVVLFITVMSLLAINARLRDRERLFEERIAVLEKDARLKPSSSRAPTTEPSGHLIVQAPPPAVVMQPAPPTESRSTQSSGNTPSTITQVQPVVAELAGQQSDASRTADLLTVENLEVRAKAVKALAFTDNVRWNYLIREDSLGLRLSDAQLMLIDSLKASRDAEARVFSDKLKEIEERYKDSFRQILDAE